MKTAKQWLNEYAESHQHKTNVTIHTICVPAIYFSIIGMLMTISLNQFKIFQTIGLENSLIANLATVISIFVLIFYLRLSFKIFLRMLIFTIICFIGNYFLNNISNLLYGNIVIFIIAWIGQFYGHKIEGKKPSFFKDLQFLLIGPVWVFEKLLK